MDLTIIANVQQHGCHVVMVPEGDISPGFAYTIGLAHTHGASPPLDQLGSELAGDHRSVVILVGGLQPELVGR
ncbi:DUF4262 domain-containing protein [Streptomyces sp. NPDC090054]|uniref:DUF4262 domain-containing protein n=1 Tax=Streptomyces sp. NPDC090054 TaxID=3365933 RepID=UPI00382F5ECB